MFGKWFSRILIGLLVAMILLPTEEDGVFASVFLSVPAPSTHQTIKKKANAQDELVDPEFIGVDESATFVRNRCDFLDLVVDSEYNERFIRSFSFAKILPGRDDFHDFLLSDFLLSLPPPIV
jgi:hypothetical protein